MIDARSKNSEPLRLIARSVVGALLVIGVVYGALGVQYGIALQLGEPPLWDSVFGLLTSEHFATGPGSVSTDQAAWYAENRLPLAVHMVLGGLVLALAPVQLIPSVRQRTPALHRWLGRVTLAAAVFVLAGACAYLVRTDSEQVYAGPLFLLDLWGLGLTYGMTGALAYYAIRKGKPLTHAAWMVLHIGLLQATPLLRLGWIVAYPFTGWTQAEITPAVAALVFPALIYAPALWLTAQPGSLKGPLVDMKGVRSLLVAFVLLGAMGTWLLRDAPPTVVATFGVSLGWAAWVAICSVWAHRHFAAVGDPLRAGEWAVHARAALLTPPAGAVVGLALAGLGFPLEISVTGGLTVGGVLCAIAGYVGAMSLRGLLAERAQPRLAARGAQR